MRGSMTVPAKASQKREEDSDYLSDDSEKQPTNNGLENQNSLQRTILWMNQTTRRCLLRR